ncbi:energy-coupling factor ABC transporter ATP-binding protein [Atopobacter phocae]|uniref:energy-coupling factor ABC transporter ATP-binding protein n=1 Tax=Atopobacter phocae TaxID=136492 RepID=UPI00046FA320|nr:energy-coupling factor ABC transporter ATP-binding protein [Atopobacter phocae]
MEIEFINVDFKYQAGTPFEQPALFDISLKIPDGSYTAIVGHTGSGKSTLLQHLNGLVKPSAGTVKIGDTTITPESSLKGLKPLRQEVGVVFQFPEAQLFEETVGLDIAFGPKNFGKTNEEAEAIARRMMRLVNLPEELFDRSPFDLSGGQMRRVAIAGVLAMEPSVLVLDEPTAGLDPKGAKEMMELFYKLNKEEKMTIVLVTHQMEDVAQYSNHAIVLENGRVVRSGHPKELFQSLDWLRDKQLDLPWSLKFYRTYQANRQDIVESDYLPLTLAELADAIVNQLKGGEAHA